MKRATEAINVIRTKAGTVAAVCECCGRISRAVAQDDEGRPAEWRLGAGWSAVPFPIDFEHRDGSRGSRYICPHCNRLLRDGKSLWVRAYLPNPDRMIRRVTP